jgi:hypothetical protein
VEKEFIPYEQALALKELGFDEPCLGFYYKLNDDFLLEIPVISYKENKNSIIDETFDNKSECITAPLYQQAFRWFREKYRLNSTIIPIENEWYFLISKKGETLTLNRPRQCYRNTYEEAELECLKKLIEIVKRK